MPPESAPRRRCFLTRRRLSTSHLIRFVVGPEGELVPDVLEKLPGRGFWLSARRDVVETAVQRGLFDKVARHVPADLSDRVEARLVARCVERLGLGRRAGAAVAGFEKTAAALRADSEALWLEATDGSPGGRRKLESAAGERAPLQALTAAEMGQAFGRATAVHVAVNTGGVARRLRREMTKLAAYRGAWKEDDRREHD